MTTKRTTKKTAIDNGLKVDGKVVGSTTLENALADIGEYQGEFNLQYHAPDSWPKGGPDQSMVELSRVFDNGYKKRIALMTIDALRFQLAQFALLVQLCELTTTETPKVKVKATTNTERIARLEDGIEALIKLAKSRKV